MLGGARTSFGVSFFMGEKMDSIIVAIITGVLSLLGVIVTNMSSNRKIENQLEVHQAVTDTKLETLTEEVRKHNNFASRIPVIEKDIEYLKVEVADLKKGETV